MCVDIVLGKLKRVEKYIEILNKYNSFKYLNTKHFTCIPRFCLLVSGALLLFQGLAHAFQ
jgi:hypothetical protein